jgi:hypothetical protein
MQGQGHLDQEGPTVSRALFVALALAIALLGALLIAGALSGDDAATRPSWQPPSLGIVLLAPYLAGAAGIVWRRRAPAGGGLVLAAAGVASFMPALFTMVDLVGFLLLPVSAWLLAGGLWGAVRERAGLSQPLVLSAIGGCLLLTMAPVVQVVGQDPRCVSVVRYADGRVERTAFQPEVSGGRAAAGAQPTGPGVVFSGSACTSDYTTLREAGASSLMSAAGLLCLLAMLFWPVGAFAYKAAMVFAAVIGAGGASLLAWAAAGPVVLLLAALAAEMEGASG